MINRHAQSAAVPICLISENRANLCKLFSCQQ
jgi:hypothetical protein